MANRSNYFSAFLYSNLALKVFLVHMKYPASRLTAKQLVAQCFNTWMKQLLSQLEINEV